MRKLFLTRSYGYNALPVIDSVVDASMRTPGVSLFLSRQFGGSLQSRNATGLFGRGWFTPWDTRLVTELSGQIVRVISQGGSARTYSLDTRTGSYFSSAGDSATLRKVGSVFELRESSGIVTRFDAAGRIHTVTDLNGNRVTALYNGSGTLSSLTHTNGTSVTLAYNGAGRPLSVTDSAGRVTTYAYDPSGLYLTTVTSHDGQVTTYTYDTTGAPATRHAMSSLIRGGTTRHFVYDANGRIDATYLGSNQQIVDFAYETAGKVMFTDAAGTNSLYYDHRGLVSKATDGLGNSTSYTYGSDLRLQQLTAASGETQSFSWCSCGNPTSITDELGNRTNFSYTTIDGFARRLSNFTDAKGNTTRYQYDVDGNLLSTQYANGSYETLVGYSAVGLPAQATNRRGQVMSLTYNAAGQITSQTFASGSVVQFEYDARGNLLRTIEGTEITTYTYDYLVAGDRLRRVTSPNGRYVNYTYDAFGRRIEMATHDGHITRYEYDSASRLYRLRDGANNLLVTYTYDASGRLERIDKGNGTFTTYLYDPAGQILSLVNHRNATIVNSRFDYTYDSRGRRITMATLEGVWRYTYDSTSQLVRAEFTSVNPTQIPDQDLQYQYDATGNRVRTALRQLKRTTSGR